MDQSSTIQIDETVKNNMDNCRLLHGLNANCQLEVLQYLSVSDLLHVSKLGAYFEELIKKWVIGNKLLNLETTDLCDDLCVVKPEILETFGKSFRKVRANGSDYRFILETLTNYCTPDILTDIQITVNHFGSENTIQSWPSFVNLQKLRLDHKVGAENVVRQLKEIAASSLDLKVLQVRCHSIQGEWMRTTNMKNLRELWMHTSRTISIDDLAYFMNEHPKVEVFGYTGVNDFLAVGNCLAKYCKNIKKFCYEDIKPDKDNADEHGLDIFKSGTNKDTSNIYSFLSSFPNLNVFTLASVSYFKYPMMSLVSRYNVRELKIYINLSAFTNQCKLKHQIDSRTVEIEIRKSSNKVERRESCPSTLQHIVDIVSQLRNLQKITISSGRKIANLHKVLELAPNLQTLSMSNVDFLHLPVEIRKIARMMRKIRQWRSDQHLVHLIVNEAQLRELEIYEKENTMTFSLDSQLSQKRFKRY